MHPSKHLPSLALLLVGTLTASAFDTVPTGNVLYAVGTTFTAEARSHAYLLWMPSEEELLRQHTYAIWSKPGAPDSPALYEPESLVQTQTEPDVIEAILRRAERLGQDLSALEAAVDGLFGIVSTGASLSRSEKVSIVIQGAAVDAEMFHNLLVLARLHPAIGLCLGAAWSGPIDGLRTYEIRMCADAEIPADPGDCRRVVGRVTLDPAVYTALPAPGRPVSVPFGRVVDGVLVPDARGHLNTRLRWSTPLALRRLALLQFGYEIYRFEAEFFHIMNIASGLQAGEARLLAEVYPEKVRKVNRFPVIIDRMLDAAEAADTIGDPDLFFHIDDNNRFEPDGTPFNDGDAFFYMVAAIDIIGREGHYSEATDVLLCRRMPPNAPRTVTVRDKVSYPSADTELQVFGLQWRAGEPVPDVPVHRFEIYRWDEPDAYVNAPFSALSAAYRGTLAANPGAADHTFDDPRGDAILERAYWYTVRAVFLNGCGETVTSPHSPPVAGVLRSRRGPGQASLIHPVVRINTSHPGFSIASVTTAALPEADPGYVRLRLDITRDESALPIDAADFYYKFEEVMQMQSLEEPEDTPIGPVPPGFIYLGSIRFRDADDRVRSLDYRFPLRGLHGERPLQVFFRARSRHGVRSGFVQQTLSTADITVQHIIHARATHQYRQLPASPENIQHINKPVAENIKKPELRFTLPELAHTWRIFRRIDSGPMSLVAQGFALNPDGEPETEKVVEEDLVLMNAGRVCYFLQLLNESGFADPLIELGCFDTTPLAPPMAPMLLPVESLPQQHARLTWASPPHGVSHFHVAVGIPGALPEDRISLDLGSAFETRADVAVTIDGELVSLDFRLYSTAFLPADAGPEHSIEIDVAEGVNYFFFVEAVPAVGETSPPGNIAAYAWTDPRDGGPDAVWPARPLPPIQNRFTNLAASLEGIVIGRLSPSVTVQRVGDLIILTPDVDPMDYLFLEDLGIPEGGMRRASGRPVLPCVIYRYQVPDDKYPIVSGDVYQVTPLTRAIASRTEWRDGAYRRVVYDPWFDIGTQSHDRRIRLRENHPMITDARYRYVVVLYRENGEIEAVFPTEAFVNRVIPN